MYLMITRKESETEIKSADLKLMVDSNLSEARGNKKIIFLKDTNRLEQPKRIKKYSEKLDSNSTSTVETGTLLPSVNINFVGLNAEGWKVMSEIEALNPNLCKTCSYFNNQTEKHQEINHEFECYRCNYCKDAVNRKNDLEGQGGKIRKLRQGCNSFWMHYQHEVKSCAIAIDDFIEKWEIIMDKKVENAVLE